MMEKYESIIELGEIFKNFNENEKSNFSKFALKLLNETFIIKTKEEDRNDYYAVLNYLRPLSLYFNIIDYELIEDKNLNIIYIKTLNNKNRKHLNKFETVILLCLRIAYFNESKKASLLDQISITLEDIKEMVRKTNIYNDEKSNNEYIDALKTLKRFKVVDYRFSNNLNFESRIFIFPSIVYLVQRNDIEELYKLIQAFNKEDKDDEEINED